MSIVNGPVARPTRGRKAALERLAALRGRDGPRVLEIARTQFYPATTTARGAVVLVHGFTNNPAQWSAFAPILQARGLDVVVPRLPGHGDMDRRAPGLARIREHDFLETVGEAIDVACGFSERVVVAGVSLGGALAAWLALARADLDAVAIVPLFGVRGLTLTGNTRLARTLEALPNRSLSWDPMGMGATIPPYAYPALQTRPLAACIRIGVDVLRLARTVDTERRVIGFVNENEPACANALAYAVGREREIRRAGSGAVYTFTGLPVNHDLIDPTNPLGRPAIVYPKLQAAIDDLIDRKRSR